jgi:hypothetical protein
MGGMTQSLFTRLRDPSPLTTTLRHGNMITAASLEFTCREKHVTHQYTDTDKQIDFSDKPTHIKKLFQRNTRKISLPLHLNPSISTPPSLFLHLYPSISVPSLFLYTSIPILLSLLLPSPKSHSILFLSLSPNAPSLFSEFSAPPVC